MSALYLVMRRVEFADGAGSVSWPIAARETEQQAREHLQGVERTLDDLQECLLLGKSPGGYVDTGLDVAAFLGGLGVAGVGHRVQKVESVSSILTPPERKLVVPH